MLGLFTPCSGLTCKKKTGSAFPLAFQLTYDGVTAFDSQSTPPRFTVYVLSPPETLMFSARISARARGRK